MTTSSSFLKAFPRLIAAFALLCTAAQTVRAFSVELHNISDDNLFTSIEFQRIGNASRTAVAKQYLKIEYPELVNQDLRLFTNNVLWQGPAGQGNGLISKKDPTKGISLYWMTFSTPQPGGVNFTEADAASWTRSIDLNDPTFVQSRKSANLPILPGQVSYIYFATIIPSTAALGDYTTNLNVELVSPVPDIQAPVLFGATCDELPRVDPIKFETTITDDFDVHAATFHFRRAGDQNYFARKLALVQNPDNPLRWNASASFSQSDLPLGSYEFYIEADDGYTRGFYGRAEAPRPFRVVDELSQFFGIAPQAGSFEINNPCAQLVGAPRLIFPAGVVQENTVISVRKLLPQALLTVGDQQTLSAFEFGPDNLHFTQPAKMIFPYKDDNQDGLVDGTGFSEQDMRVFWFDNFEWRSLGGSVDTAKNTVTIDINHFSVYGLFPAGAVTADAVRPREKIITPNSDGTNDFAQFGISGQFEVSIYDMKGRRIRKLENLSVWDGKTDDGTSAESGAYVYQVKSDQLEKPVSGTIGVAR